MLNLRTIVTPFFANHLSRQMRELYVSTAILDLGASMVAIFEPIYLWTIGFPLHHIILFYLGALIAYFFLVPLGGKFARTHGYEHSLSLSTPFLVLYLLSLYAIPRHPIFIVAAIISIACFRMFYWPAHRALISRYTEDAESGRSLSGLSAFSILANILGPIVGGALLTFFGFPVLFTVASLIMLASVVPLLMTPEVFEPHDLSYRDAFRRLLRPEFRRTIVAHWGYGEEFVEQIIWPIFVLLVIGSFFGVGAVMTVAAVMMLIATIVVGRITDEHHRHGVLRTGTLVLALSYFARLLATSPLGVLIVQSLYRVSRVTVALPFVTLDSKRAREYSVMKSVVLYEMSIVMGKIGFALVSLAIVALAPMEWWPFFLLAAAVSVFYALR